jgi:hypothetical protein
MPQFPGKNFVPSQDFLASNQLPNFSASLFADGSL